MDMQNVKELAIPEGDVRTIYDSSCNLLWGRLAYDTKYAGDTIQTTYSGKNLVEGSQDFSGTWTNSGTWSTASENYNGLVVKSKSIAWNGLYKEITVESGKIYTFSLFAKAGSARQVVIYLTGGGATATTQPVNKAVNITTSWQRVYITFTVNATGTLHARIENTEAYDTPTYICGYQLEESDALTSYEPYVGGIPSPNPDYPQDIQVVTGEQTVTISDGVNSHDYTVNLGSLELAKIGTYQDYIYKSGDEWYVHKEIGKQIYNGSEDWLSASYGVNSYYISLTDRKYPDATTPNFNYSNLFRGVPYSQRTTSGDNIIYNGPAGEGLYIRNTAYTSVNDFKSMLSSNNLISYYVVSTPTDTQITDSTLIGQFNAIHEWLTRYGYNSTVSGNLPLLIEQTNIS